MVSSETLIRPLPLRIGQDLQTYMKFAHFCGLASYYRTFVPDFANIARPLHDLTRKNATFEWSNACETSFTELKRLLTSPPILCTPRDEGTYILDTDASDYAVWCFNRNRTVRCELLLMRVEHFERLRRDTVSPGRSF